MVHLADGEFVVRTRNALSGIGETRVLFCKRFLTVCECFAGGRENFCKIQTSGFDESIPGGLKIMTRGCRISGKFGERVPELLANFLKGWSNFF